MASSETADLTLTTDNSGPSDGKKHTAEENDMNIANPRYSNAASALVKAASIRAAARVEAERLAYLDRFQSYSPATYFAKPASLSPIVCARFGWRNASPDLLVCDQCRAAWMILLPPELSAIATAKVTAQTYQPQLATAHKTTCRFARQAAAYCDFYKRTTTKLYVPSVVPTLLAVLVPEEVLDLLEHPAPKRLVLPLWKKWLSLLILPRVSEGITVPGELQGYFNEKGKEGDDGLDQVVHGLSEACSDHDGSKTPFDESVTVEQRKLAISLVLLGWQPVSPPCRQTDSDATIPSCLEASCPFCRSSLVFNPPTSAANALSSTERPTKRARKTQSLVEAHRHDCPYVAGFCWIGAATWSAVPLWQSVGKRLWEQQHEQLAGDPHLRESADRRRVWQQMHTMLQSGISRVRKRGSATSDSLHKLVLPK